METTKPSSIAEAKKLLTEKAEEGRAIAEGRYGQSFPFKILFDLKGRSAGQAISSGAGDHKIRLNIGMIKCEGGWEHLYGTTVLHEVAHVVQYSYSGFPKNRKSNPPHGRYWKQVMGLFGLPADRTHSVLLPKSREQRK